MSTQYAGADAFPSDYTIPDDGEARVATSVNVAFEALGDRTKYLKNRVDTFLAIVTPLPNIAALTAIPTPTDGLTRIVERFGVYVFDASSSESPWSPNIFAANDASPGRWVRAGNSLRSITRWMSPTRFLTSDNGSGLALTTRDKFAYFSPHASIYVDPTLSPSFQHKVYTRVAPGAALQFRQTGEASSTYGVQLCLDDYLKTGALITRVEVVLAPGTGRSGLPTQKISAGVFRQVLGQNFDSLTASGDFTEDSSSSVSAYESIHTLALNLNQNNTVDVGSSFFLQVWNEQGSSNCLFDNQILGVYIYQSNVFDSLFA